MIASAQAISPFTRSVTLPSGGLDLEATLSSGQSFSWRKSKEGPWNGWIEGRPCRVWIEKDILRAEGPDLSSKAITHYFGLDIDLSKILASFPHNDPWLKRAFAFAPGLRLLRQEPWETLCNFICSALKQVVQIEQINTNLRRTFGSPYHPDHYTFPDPQQLACRSEKELRECRLGFRARHLYIATQQILSKEVSLEKIALLSTDDARTELCRLQGVGEKVANCVLLFAFYRWEAFPIDVWVERALRTLYFPDQPKIPSSELTNFTQNHFGPYRGYAQQFLFHWMRKEWKQKNLPNQRKDHPTRGD